MELSLYFRDWKSKLEGDMGNCKYVKKILVSKIF